MAAYFLGMPYPSSGRIRRRNCWSKLARTLRLAPWHGHSTITVLLLAHATRRVSAQVAPPLDEASIHCRPVSACGCLGRGTAAVQQSDHFAPRCAAGFLP